MDRPLRTLILVLFGFAGLANAGEKAAYQTTKLIELTAGATGFCFVVQLGDLGYAAVGKGKVPNVMVVGDPIQVKIKNDTLFVKTKTETGWHYDNDYIETHIRIRGRVSGSGDSKKLPSCALAISLH
jgi:hypothetical protein